MCTGMNDWLEEVRTDGKKEGKSEGLNIACQIIFDLKNGLSELAIASKYDIDLTEVSMLSQTLQFKTRSRVLVRDSGQH